MNGRRWTPPLPSTLQLGNHTPSRKVLVNFARQFSHLICASSTSFESASTFRTSLLKARLTEHRSDKWLMLRHPCRLLPHLCGRRSRPLQDHRRRRALSLELLMRRTFLHIPSCSTTTENAERILWMFAFRGTASRRTKWASSLDLVYP